MNIEQFKSLSYAEMADEQREILTQGLCSGISEVIPHDMEFIIICFGEETGLVSIASSLTPKTCSHCKQILCNLLDIVKESIENIESIE